MPRLAVLLEARDRHVPAARAGYANTPDGAVGAGFADEARAHARASSSCVAYGSENAYSLLFGVPKPKLLYPEPQ